MAQMMNRISRAFALALILQASSLCSFEWLTEAKASYFHPTGSTFKDIYSGSGLYGLEMSFSTVDRLYVWTSASAFYKSGKTDFGTHTSVVFVPLGLGLKYFLTPDPVKLYIGAGGIIEYVRTHDKSDFVPEHTSKWGGGGIAKFGLLWNCTRSIFLDFFVDYSIVQVNNSYSQGGTLIPQNADMSGVSGGAGIGYRFGGGCN